MQLSRAILLVRKSFLLFIILFALSALTNRIAAFENADVEECLMDLNVSELLRLKHSLQQMQEDDTSQGSFWEKHEENHTSEGNKSITKPKQDDESCVSQNCLKPMAMALTGMPRSYYSNAGHHSHHAWYPQPEEKQSKLTTLFNITITSLAFLAFGGYLLCLIVHAIKSKGATYFYPVTTAASTAVDGGVRKIKIYRRGRRALMQHEPLRPNYYEFYRNLRATVIERV